MAAMVILSFAASLPYGAVLGVLTAWLTEEGIGPAVIGAIGLGTMGYAFKYLWAPGFQRAKQLPFLKSAAAGLGFYSFRPRSRSH